MRTVRLETQQPIFLINRIFACFSRAGNLNNNQSSPALLSQQNHFFRRSLLKEKGYDYQ